MSKSPENKAAWRIAYDYYVYCMTTIVSRGIQPLDVYKDRMKKIQEHIDDELTVCLMTAVYDYFDLKERKEEHAKSKAN